MGPSHAIYVAVDRPDLEGAESLARRLAGAVGGLKLGLEFWTAQGPSGARAVGELGLPIFLDLKLHDIPNTVAGAVHALAPLRPALVTLHAAGGPTMLRAAAAAAADLPARPKLLAITVLTSLDADDLEVTGIAGSPVQQVLRLARLAQDCAIDGVVCSPLEAAAVRTACGPDFLIVTPGIRPEGASAADQKRVLSPRAALAAGADILVVGRAITGAPDPRAAAEALFDSVPEAA